MFLQNSVLFREMEKHAITFDMFERETILQKAIQTSVFPLAIFFAFSSRTIDIRVCDQSRLDSKFPRFRNRKENSTDIGDLKKGQFSRTIFHNATPYFSKLSSFETLTPYPSIYRAFYPNRISKQRDRFSMGVGSLTEYR